MITPEILYEDNHVIVAVKPQNMPSQPDASKDESFLDLVREYVRIKYNKPGEAYLGLVHRLDRPAGGLMVFARTSKAASRLSEQVRNGSFHKVYYAITTDSLEGAGTLEDYLVKDTKTNTSRIAAPNEPFAKKAVLDYAVQKRKDGFSLVRVHLKTGRPHQIRVQMKGIGTPLAGDVRYGGPKAEKLCLWATALSFIHPTRKEELIFQCPWPSYWPWSLFSFDNILPR